MTEDGEVFCNWGWTVTDKAFKTEEYRKAHDEERELCKGCFGFDIGTVEDMMRRKKYEVD